MKVQYPDDHDGRRFACIARAKLIAEVLFIAADTHGNIQFSSSALMALSRVSEELAEELLALHNIAVAESDARVVGEGGA